MPLEKPSFVVGMAASKDTHRRNGLPLLLSIEVHGLPHLSFHVTIKR